MIDKTKESRQARRTRTTINVYSFLAKALHAWRLEMGEKAWKRAVRDGVGKEG